ncbi:hypothetical protein C9426_09830 [Serratia sp. S1B]|nr:hypothetical protein C9426_09830 [Serratia sp. S1B]
MLKNEKLWLLVAILCGVAGFFSGFLSLMAAGGASGSGCGSQCFDFLKSAANIGILFFGGSLFSAYYAMSLASKKREQDPGAPGYRLVKTLGVLTMLVTGVFFFLLMLWAGSL